MAEQRSGLRFDIYERVHLADGTVGMKELDEVELVPHIQVFTEGEQAVLKGNLYLAGKYQGETGDESRTLEHFIPVEITLPINRITNLDEVAVEIDNFDVDLISSRSLNVTGVLTLLGIEMISAPEESWREEEETIFVHERPNGLAEEAPEFPAVQALAEPPAVQPSVEYTPQRAAESTQFPDRESPQPYEETAEEFPGVSEEDFEEVIANADEEDELNAAFALMEEPASEPIDNAVEASGPVEEKNELKIAFGSKPSNDHSFYLKSLIHKEGNRGEANIAAVSADEQDADSQRINDLEWKRLFVRSEIKGTIFHRLRLCIVQKDETLETLSNKYEVNAREILLANRLTEQDLVEGKVICIP